MTLGFRNNLLWLPIRKILELNQKDLQSMSKLKKVKDSKECSLILEAKEIFIYQIKLIQRRWKDLQRRSLIKKNLFHFTLKWSKAKDMSPIKIYKELPLQNPNSIFRKILPATFQLIRTEVETNSMIKSWYLRTTKNQ